MIFFRTKLDPEIQAEEIPYKPCELGLCDGSGLVEVEAVWFGGIRMVKCECRKI